MFGSVVLDIAISLVLVYLLLSLLASGLGEAIAALTRMRAKTLESGIRTLLLQEHLGTDDLVEKFYGHELIRSISPPKMGKIGLDVKEEKRRPSYVSPRLFALALLDIAAPTNPDRGPIRDVQEMVSKIQANGELSEGLRNSLVKLLGDTHATMETARAGVEAWFDEAMKRTSGAYKRWSQLILFGIAVVLVAAINADTLNLAQTLRYDPIMRQALVARAVRLAEKDATTTASPSTGTSITVPASTVPSMTVADLEHELVDLSIPLGWPNGLPKDATGWSLKVVGVLITAFAVSLGAPFWFDALQKLVNIRSSGTTP